MYIHRSGAEAWARRVEVSSGARGGSKQCFYRIRPGCIEAAITERVCMDY